MKKLFVISVPIILIALIVVAFLVSDDPAPGKVGSYAPQDRSEALVAWHTAGPEGRVVLCQVFNDPEITEEYLFQQMTQGQNKVSAGVARAKIDIMKEEC